MVENARLISDNKVANADQNRPYNRYTDIGKLKDFLTKTTFSSKSINHFSSVPFDDNYVKLTPTTFTEASTSYVNAR